MRSSRPLTVLAVAIAASLLPTPRLAAQQSPVRPTPPPVARPAAAEAEVGTDDEGNLRRLVDEEAVHRDRAARIARLRTLAEQGGQRERLADIEKLDRVENDRFASSTQQMRRRMSVSGQQKADEVIRKGGVVHLRRANQSSQEVVRRPASNRASGAESTPVRRPAAAPAKRSTTTPRAAPTRSGTSSGTSRSGSSSSSGRSPR